MYRATIGRHDAKSVLIFQCFATYFTKMISSIATVNDTEPPYLYLLFELLSVTVVWGKQLLIKTQIILMSVMRL